MALLNAAAQKKLSNSQFAYVAPDGTRKLPIHDAEHVRNAMARFNQTQFASSGAKSTAHSKILAAAKKFGIDVENFSEDAESIAFSADLDAESDTTGDMIVRTGKLFEIGDYPDKSFSFDEADLENAVANFEPVPLDLEHVPTVLDGKLGTVQRVFASEDGKSLMGEVHLPKWLDSVLDDGSRKVSATWDRGTKLMQRLAIVRNPRVSDAALMAAFSASEGTVDFAPTGTRAGASSRSKHNTSSGQYAIQRIHDVAASSGAVCKNPATMASRHEMTAIQQAHDMAVEHGATCESMTDGRGYGTFSTEKSTSNPTIKPRSRTLNLIEFITGKAKEEGVELDTADLQAAFGTAPEVEKLKTELAKRDADLATFKAAQEVQTATLARMADERRQAEAVTFAQTLVSAHKVTPATAEKLAPLAARIAQTDSAVTFGEGQKSTLELLKDVCESMTDLSIFTGEKIASEEMRALFNVEKTAGVSKNESNPAIVEKMLAATPEGREILKTRQASK